jgi:hypothetical protein
MKQDKRSVASSNEDASNTDAEATATLFQLADAMRRIGGLFALPKNWLIKLRERNLRKGTSLH